MQEEQTGKKRQEKLEWMYATPATGSSQNANELEDYLLGKKRVDKMLTADENEKVSTDLSLATKQHLITWTTDWSCAQELHRHSVREHCARHCSEDP